MKNKKPYDKKFSVVGDGLPEICTLSIGGLSGDGELLAVPLEWKSHKKPPYIVVLESGRGKSAAVGDRILAKLRKISPHFYQASVIRVLESEQAKNIIGVFVSVSTGGGIIEPISRKNKESFMVLAGDTAGAENGELVAAVTLPNMPSMSMGYAKITEKLGRVDAPRAASLIAASIHNLPSIFSPEALTEAAKSPLPKLGKKHCELRDIPFVTIDGEDARDFDDAVFAESHGDGFHIVVAIAEVAYYGEEGSALDKTAFERGNSVYFPDRVIPMLPERLSNGLCSLMPNEDRYCLAVHIWIDAKGAMQEYKFVRGLMKSVARLTYEEVEDSGKWEVISGEEKRNKNTTYHLPLATELTPLITNLFNAYTALANERDNRGALDLDLPEYKIYFDTSGNVADIAEKTRLESHRLIECFMIAANVAAADFLLKHKASGVYRVHEAPSDEKLEDLRSLLLASDYRLQKGAVYAKHFNRILKASASDPRKAMIHTAVLRSQMQAFYSVENTGHFGLGLQKYCHFTSPIRRYADLLVHRAIIGILDGENASHHNLAATALHISETERRAMLAERDAADRYKVSFMSKEIGKVFSGIIGGLNEYGLFVNLNKTGITGFIPVRNLGKDFFTFDRKKASFTGQRSKSTFALGDAITIRVQEANAVTGSLIFAIETPELEGLPPLREKFAHKKKSPKHKRPNNRPKDGKKPHKGKIY